MCFTASHAPGVARELLADLKAAVEAAVADPAGAKAGSAPVYGAAAASPDRGLVAEFLGAYQDAVLDG